MITNKDEFIEMVKNYYQNLTDEQVKERFISLGFKPVGSGEGEIVYKKPTFVVCVKLENIRYFNFTGIDYKYNQEFDYGDAA